MKRFRFRLEKLERLRHHREKLARRELATRVAALNAVDDELSVIAQNLVVCRDDDRHANSLGEAVARGLLARQHRLSEHREQLEQAVESAREAYAERRRDFRTLQNLRERAVGAWQVEMRREEQQEMDEVARVRFARRADGIDGEMQ